MHLHLILLCHFFFHYSLFASLSRYGNFDITLSPRLQTYHCHLTQKLLTSSSTMTLRKLSACGPVAPFAYLFVSLVVLLLQ